MHSVGALALATAPLVLVARADVDFDGDDLPANCRSICRPIVELSRRCDASDLFDDDDAKEDEYDRNEDRLRAQCFCTNNSFDVANITGLCADCIRQNARTGNDDDDDDHDDELKDINQIIATCGFGTTASFVPSVSAAADSISVVASAPTAASQLTTTFTDGNKPTAASSGSGQNGGTTTSGSGDPNGDSFAIPGVVPLGGFSGSAVLYSFGAFVAGVAVFWL